MFHTEIANIFYLSVASAWRNHYRIDRKHSIGIFFIVVSEIEIVDLSIDDEKINRNEFGYI